MTRIAMWSGPRNLSTAMMRSWENRADTEVLDEPLYAAYLAATNLDHPGADEIIAAGPADASAAILRCVSAPNSTAISYQKHMAHHLLPGMDRGWIGELRNCLLLRDPRRVLASYTRVRKTVTLSDIGIPQQLELVDRCELVVDSDDFLADPRGYQTEICRRLGVAFDEAMLAWPAGPRDTDGVWAPHWYAAVESSTHFGPPPGQAPEQISGALRDLAAEAVDIYEGLRVRRLLL
jgi:hypothetical protein